MLDRKSKEHIFTFLTYFILIVMLIPAAWIIFTSVRPEVEVGFF